MNYTTSSTDELTVTTSANTASIEVPNSPEVQRERNREDVFLLTHILESQACCNTKAKASQYLGELVDNMFSTPLTSEQSAALTEFNRFLNSQ